MVGTAAWTIPAQHAHGFPPEGSHLERYSRRFPAVEINSSFYRPHRPSTYQRWASTVPAHFRFAVKVPKEITHLRRLANADEPLERFLAEAGALGEKLGPLLLQLPPSSLRWTTRLCVPEAPARPHTGRRGMRAAAPELVHGGGGAVAF